MKNERLRFINKILFLILLFLISFTNYSQDTPEKSEFWKKIQIGGGLGLGFGTGYSNIMVAPSAIYNFNDYVALGVGLQYSYLKQKNLFSSHLYGGSVIGLFNPLPEVQLSLEVEELRVNQTFDGNTQSRDFWNTGLFVGAGYRTQNVTIGARYNLLFQEDKGVYGSALIPFVRVFF